MDTFVPPHDQAAEWAVLGSILLDDSAIGRIAARLKPGHFYNRKHAKIYEKSLELFAKSDPIDIVTLGNALEKTGELDIVGGRTFLALLESQTPSAANAEYYSDIVIDYAKRRQAIKIAQGMIEDALVDSAESVLNTGLEKLFGVASFGTESIETLGHSGISEFLDRMKDAMEGKIQSVPYGFSRLDRELKGMRNSELIIVCGRPGMAKTSFGLNVIENLCIHRKIPVGMFSLEMSKQNLIDRLIAQIARIDSRKLINGELDVDEWQSILDSTTPVGSAPIVIDDAGDLDLISLITKSRMMKYKHNVQLIIIDYLQLMSGKGDNREQEVASTARACKRIAKELQIPVMALAQLSRGPESRADHRPILSDLRESGSIEADADVVIGLYRDNYYDQTLDDTAELIVLKNRNGWTGTVKMKFEKTLTRFENL